MMDTERTTEQEISMVESVLLAHRDCGITSVTEGQGDNERITGASAYCYCGGTDGIDWIKDGPKWRGTFNVKNADAELRRHLAEEIVAALGSGSTEEGERS